MLSQIASQQAPGNIAAIYAKLKECSIHDYVGGGGEDREVEQGEKDRKVRNGAEEVYDQECRC
jgi:hypothetical protein